MYRNVGKHNNFAGSQSLWKSQHTISKPMPRSEEVQEQLKRPLELYQPPSTKRNKKYQRTTNDD
jgi:hypothetical protein